MKGFSTEAQNSCQNLESLMVVIDPLPAGGNSAETPVDGFVQVQQVELRVSRREVIALPALLGLSFGILSAQPAKAVQGLTAGRLPGEMQDVESNA